MADQMAHAFTGRGTKCEYDWPDGDEKADRCGLLRGRHMGESDVTYKATIWCSRPCEECGDEGINDKVDCGCCWEQVVGSSASLVGARLMAAKAARRRTDSTGACAVYRAEDGDETLVWSL